MLSPKLLASIDLLIDVPQPPLTPRDYQLEAVQANMSSYQAGHNRLLVALPTGCGKAVIFSIMMLPFEHLGRALVIAHREELIDQAAKQIRRANPCLKIGLEQASLHASPLDDVVVASIQTLVSPGRLARVAGAESFNLVVVDEAHHAIAPSYVKVLAQLGLAPDITDLEQGGKARSGHTTKQLNEILKARHEDFVPDPDRLLVGFTATPHRTDGIGLQYIFDRISYSKTIKEMMQLGWLCKIKGKKIATATDISKVKKAGGDYQEAALAKVVNTPDRNKLAVQMWEANALGRKTAVFCVDVEHTQDMCQAFQDAGHRAEYVVGTTVKELRRDIISEFHQVGVDVQPEELGVLTNCMVLTEGFDDAAISCLLMARPTQSSLLYTQMLGRGTRLHPDKEELLVLDMEDIARAGVASVNTLFGLPPKLNVEKGVLDVLEEVDAILAEFPVSQEAFEMAATLEEVRQLSIDFNPLQQAAMPEHLDRELELQWVRTSFGYTLSAGGISVGVIEDMLGHCTVELTGSTVKHLGQEYSDALGALQASEAWLADNLSESYQFSSKKAPWRVQGARQPASSKQLYHLRRGHVTFPESISKADASMLLSRLFARQGGRN